MGLVQNLKKTLSNLAEKILVELSYQYIKHLAKQTSKKQGNYSSIMFSQNHLTKASRPGTIATSSADTSEKIIMETQTESVAQVREWSIDRIHTLAEYDDIQSQLNAIAIAEEFDEWINIPEGVDQLSCLVMERKQEFDDL